MKKLSNIPYLADESRRVYVVLIAICTVYIGLVAGNMTRWSIWFDEAFSAYLMRFNLAEITRFTALDVHPPVYYWVLKVWTSVFGTSEEAFRSLSALFGVVALVGLFFLIRKLFRSTNWALFAAAVVAISPLMVRFGHEARMYTMTLAIVFWASYVLLRATQKNAHKGWWLGYSLLLVIGMLTHYYAALAWLAHWAWRYSEKRAGRIKQFFSREWLWVHALAVGLFLWWIPVVIRQFSGLLAGFWIPNISLYTPMDYLSNMLIYRQYGQADNWWAVGLFAVIGLLVVVLWRGVPSLVRRSSSGVNMLMMLAVVPPAILTLVSLPPMTPTFMDRYIMFAQFSLLALAALAIAALYRTRAHKKLARNTAIALVVCLLIGIGNVYYFGNYNKNSSTSIRVKEVMQQIERTPSVDAQPVIASSPWLYYEAVFYESKDRPVYFVDLPEKEYSTGSLAMLRDSDYGKIKDVYDFALNNRYVWYLESRREGDVEPPVATWKRIVSVDGYDSIENNVRYRASLFDTQPNAE